MLFQFLGTIILRSTTIVQVKNFLMRAKTQPEQPRAGKRKGWMRALSPGSLILEQEPQSVTLKQVWRAVQPTDHKATSGLQGHVNTHTHTHTHTHTRARARTHTRFRVKCGLEHPLVRALPCSPGHQGKCLSGAQSPQRRTPPSFPSYRHSSSFLGNKSLPTSKHHNPPKEQSRECQGETIELSWLAEKSNL